MRPQWYGLSLLSAVRARLLELDVDLALLVDQEIPQVVFRLSFLEYWKQRVY